MLVLPWASNFISCADRPNAVKRTGSSKISDTKSVEMSSAPKSIFAVGQWVLSVDIGLNQSFSTCAAHKYATEEFLKGHGQTLLKLRTFCKLLLLIENLGSSCATNFMICLLSSLCLRKFATWRFTGNLPRAQCTLSERISRNTGDFCCHENKIWKQA